MASPSKKSNDQGEEKQRKSFIDTLYVKLLREPSTNFIIVLVGFVFIIWMVIPLFTVLTGAVYFNGEWSGNAIGNVFTDEKYFNWAGDESTQFYSKSEDQFGGPSDAVVVSEGIAYVAERGEGIEVLNVTNPQNIVEIRQFYDDYSSFQDLEVRDDLLYTAAGKSGLLVFNISDVTTSFKPFPFPEAQEITNSTNFLTLDGNFAYMGLDGQGFAIINITDPNYLELLSINTRYQGYPFGEKVRDIAIKDDYAFLAAYDSGLAVVDISNKS